MSTLRSLFVGSQPTFTVTFRGAVAQGVDPETGTPTDPDPVTFMWKVPAGTETSYVYGTDDEVTKTSTGVYAFVPPVIAVSGQYCVRAKGTGVLIAATEQRVNAIISPFTTP